MDKIAIIYGETFLYWSSIILTLAVAAAICVFLFLYLREKNNGISAAFLVPMAMAASLILSRIMHWYSMANAYSGLKGALTTFTGGGYALMGVFAGCGLPAAAATDCAESALCLRLHGSGRRCGHCRGPPGLLLYRL